ncbi:MAG: HupE/UreJ family protein [Rhodobacteraceae bacterium]|nr:HupE/UreJ family protein [Paracoccaceae bacterium]
MARLLTLLALLMTLTTAQVQAHALEPGYLEIQALSGDTHSLFWRKPAVKGKPMAMDVLLPENCDLRSPPAPRYDGAAWVSRWTARCDGGLVGRQITIEGLERTNTDVLVRFQGHEDSGFTSRLTPDQPSFALPENPGAWQVLGDYIALGTDHILTGFDHLLFVFALLLLIRDWRRLVGAISAFTLAHSITLAAASLGWLRVPAPPVEAVIALSIVFLAVELSKRRDDTLRLSERWPWLVSFSFGLLHGLGFAGALRDIGLPESDLVMALLGFNLGVEIGQLAFVAVVLAIAALLTRITPPIGAQLRRRDGLLNTAFTYFVGSLAAYWFVERVAGFIL